MSSFLSELGKKLADRWLSLLALPGLLLLGTGTVGYTLGQAHWSDAARLARTIRTWATATAGAGITAAILAAVAILLAASALGVAATAVGSLTRRLWVDDWPDWAGRGLVRRRQRRWDRADSAYSTRKLDVFQSGEPDAGAIRELDRLAECRNRICLTRPDRPTWTADRLAAVDTRIYVEYGLDLGSAWPRLWLTVPDAVRTEVRAAATAFDASTMLGGWGLLYLAIGALWWPSAVIGAVVLITAQWRARSTVALYADLIESVVDLHGSALAQALGLTAQVGRLTEELGTQMTSLLRKGT